MAPHLAKSTSDYQEKNGILSVSPMRVEAYSKSQVFAESLSVLFMALIVAAASGLGVLYILFPELGALSSDVLLRPHGKWAREPWKLVATPTITASIGILISDHLPFGVVAVLAAMGAGIAVLFLLKSAVAPAISAGVLPVVLRISSWHYPLCILGTLTALTAVLLIWRVTIPGKSLSLNRDTDRKVVDVLESRPIGKWWLPSLVLFVTSMAVLAQVSGWRFVLFPPLIVMAFEMLGHPNTCPWAKQPYTFPLICIGAALAGVCAVNTMGGTPIAAALVLIVTFAMLRVFRLRMPPALAIGLIPFILPTHTIVYALSVAIGTVGLTGWFVLHRKLITPAT
jgi:hypothetical protein